MKKVHTFLAYYSVIIATLLLVWSIFISQKPAGYVLTLLLFPISLYFWVLTVGKMPHDEIHSEDTASSQKIIGLLLTITMTMVSSSIILYIIFVGIQSKTNTVSNSTELEKSFKKMQGEINSLKKTATSIDEISTKLTLMQSTLLRIENNKENHLLDKELQEILNTTSATPESTITPIKNAKP